ncbi:hypothetical protein Tco_0404597 [Tanacetum coccineum]
MLVWEEADSETSPKRSLRRKLFKTCCMNWGEVNPTHKYYNGSRTSKDNEDPSWSTSFKTRRTHKTSSALEDFICVVFVLDRNIERIHDASTPEERRDFLNWARSVAQAKAESEDLDECDKMLRWASYTAESATSAPEEDKWRFLKWAHSTSTIQHKSWSLQEEISKPFETALKLFQEELNQNEMAMEYGCSDLKQEHMIYTCDKEKHGVYQWEKFPESVMIKGRPTVNRFGFVTIKLSGKWIAKSIHKMLKDGIDTWAPKLPVERVIIDYPSVCEETDLDLFQRRVIGYTLMRIIEYCKVDWLSNLVICRFGLCKQKADWILYVTLIRQLEYIEMCFTAAKRK